ncbi:cyclase family protein [Ruminiclostridium papyrosolvens DSM 2782]|uniref:Cyclase family protein n=1 Tax=Ruminiclostridium papyrosolvens DSM 2782 TaxID=588581 RepID=F1TDQ9_9FIRM|nr:cyclase family protein [Ruminiclostridium papyrosolvens]EGD47355.1 cyclase family protein [Ruminiclostridium papyrosolvens DSM 2782]WES34701.1 cyclase family protein [Ruminiclostridium papyrosolvens DSM 2782]
MDFNVIELGIGIPFTKDSPTEKINFKTSYLFTHNDERWNSKPDRQSFFKEKIEMDLHCISHVDAINHRAQNKIGFKGSKYESEPSTYQNGADTIPIIRGKALMLDFPKFLKVDILKEENEITVNLIEKCLNFQGTGIDDYKIILIRTGHIVHWKNGEYDKYFEKEVGLNVEAITWLAEKNIIAVGADNFAVENIPTKENSYSNFYPGHKKFLGEKGIYIIENLDLDDLSARKINRFYFIAAPIRFKNASAALINPIALL